MDTFSQITSLLDEVLSLGGRAQSFSRSTSLLGAIPELDSMAVVSLITRLEESLGIVIDDDDIDASAFESVGSLVDFAQARLGG